MFDFIIMFIIYFIIFIMIAVSLLFCLGFCFVSIKWFYEFLKTNKKNLFYFIIILYYLLFSFGGLFIASGDIVFQSLYLTYVGCFLVGISLIIFFCCAIIQNIKQKNEIKKELFNSEQNSFNKLSEQQFNSFTADPSFLIINGGSPKNSSSIIVTNDYCKAHVIMNYDGHYMEKFIEFKSNVLNWFNYKWDWCREYTPNDFLLDKNIDDGLVIFKKLIYDYDDKKIIKNDTSLSQEELSYIKSMGVSDDLIELSNALRPKYAAEVKENIGFNVLQDFANTDSALGGFMFSKFKYMNKNMSSPLLLPFIVSNTISDIKSRMLVRVFSKYGLVIFEKHEFDGSNYVPKSIVYSSVKSCEELFNLIKKISIQ